MSPAEHRAIIVDDDDAVRDALSLLLETHDIPSASFPDAKTFLNAWDGTQRGCLLLDIRMPGINGLELQTRLNDEGCHLPIIFMTGHGDVPMAVEAMRKGAFDFLRKPVQEEELVARIGEAFVQESAAHSHLASREQAQSCLATLTEREREVFEKVASGSANKVIAAELGISERTVEVHRSQVMKKLNAKTLADVVRVQIVSEVADLSKIG
ncbi:MAG: response regulator [Pseudomonadota bacterium]